jgi:hypothetical protein
MTPDTCSYHTELVSDIATIKADIAYIRQTLDKQDDRIGKHVEDGDKVGGFRDRLIILEQEIASLKKAMWVRVGVAGAIGGLIGSGSTEAITLLVRWVLKV